MKRALAVLLLASCGDNLKPLSPPGEAGPDVDAAIDAPPDSPPQMGSVTVNATVRTLTEAGEVLTTFQDLRVIDSAETVIMPTVQGDGSLLFSNVAPGAYWVCDVSFVSRHKCYQGGTATFDFSHAKFGRTNLTKATAGTNLVLTVTGATSAAQPTSEFLDVRSLNTGFIDYPFPPTLPGTPLVHTIDYRDRGLMEPADVLTVTQLASKTSGSETYVAATRFGMVSGVSMSNGSSTAAAVNLGTTLAQDQTLSFNLKRSLFTTVAGDPGPGMAYSNVDLNGYSERKPYGFQPWVFWYTGAGNGTQDLALNMTFGDPWPASHVTTMEAAFWFAGTVTATGATTSSPKYTFVAHYRPASELSGDITPQLSRPTALRVNGMDAQLSQTGTGLTPTLSWTAPSLGTATKYTVYTYRIVNQGGGTVSTANGEFTTTATSLKIPPGYIFAGEQYMFTVRAWAVPGYNGEHPLAPVDRYDLADAISETHRP